ncbi:MAG TPA: holo-[acyl-carrier-protein] synthase [Thermosulfidibacter takaii]|uniref:Holo-[acyl-carrier-protein] synthase n=1 Tax=Thermosulfidibacter takaii TaxID=412593 RepID=A0A7C0U7F6_9BACT|nr:holo-[acyl-carrier-protein] synthase [Thermosulfidibacter takaii]
MIVGVGIDTVELDRIERAMKRWPRFLDRILTPREKGKVEGRVDRVAARWAAKEALFKALDPPSRGLRMGWRDVEVMSISSGRPFFVLKGRVRRYVRARNLRLHLSLSHDRGRAVALVLAQGGPRSRTGKGLGL